MTTPFDQRRIWFALFAVYMVVTGALKAMTGYALGPDQAEIMVHAQRLEWGYGVPPLYAWLQWAVFQVTGPGLAGLVLLKSLLLWLVPVLMLFVLSQALPVREAGLATLSLILVPQIGFFGQVALGPEVLALVLVLAFALGLWVVLRGPAHGSDWLGLGVVGGLAMLALPVAVLVPVAMVLAAVSLPELRRNLSWQGVGLACAVAGLICLGPAIWALTRDLTPGEPVAGVPEPLAPVSAMMAELAQMARAAGIFSFPVLVAVGAGAVVARLRGAEQVTARTGDEALMMAWLLRGAGLGAVGLVAVVLLWPGAAFDDAWLMLPLVWVAPLLTLWLLPQLGEAGCALAARALVGAGVLVGGAVAFQDAVIPSPRTAPFDVLAPEVVARLPDGVPITGEPWVLGNLVLEAPGLAARLIAPGTRPAPGTVVLWGDVAPALRDGVVPVYQPGVAGIADSVSAPFHVRSAWSLVINLGYVPDGVEG